MSELHLKSKERVIIYTIKLTYFYHRGVNIEEEFI